MLALTPPCVQRACAHTRLSGWCDACACAYAYVQVSNANVVFDVLPAVLGVDAAVFKVAAVSGVRFVSACTRREAPHTDNEMLRHVYMPRRASTRCLTRYTGIGQGPHHKKGGEARFSFVTYSGAMQHASALYHGIHMIASSTPALLPLHGHAIS